MILRAGERLRDVLHDEYRNGLPRHDGAAARARLLAAKHEVGVLRIEVSLLLRGCTAEPVLETFEAEDVPARREARWK